MNATKEGKEVGTTTAPYPPTDTADLAELIGLDDASLLGTQPIDLSPETIDKLRRFGPKAELNTHEVGRILGVSHNQVGNYCLANSPPKLGHRRSSRVFLISAASLAEFVKARNKPSVPTSGHRPAIDTKRAKASEGRVRARHNLHAK